MIKLLLAAALMVAGVALADEEKAQYCGSFAQNATLGGAQALRGKPRAIVPVKREHIIELLEHGKLLDQGGIVVFAEDFETEENKKFIRDSVFLGYDYVVNEIAAGHKDSLPSTAQEAFEMFFADCMAHDRI